MQTNYALFTLAFLQFIVKLEELRMLKNKIYKN